MFLLLSLEKSKIKSLKLRIWSFIEIEKEHMAGNSQHIAEFLRRAAAFDLSNGRRQWRRRIREERAVGSGRYVLLLFQPDTACVSRMRGTSRNRRAHRSPRAKSAIYASGRRAPWLVPSGRVMAARGGVPDAIQGPWYAVSILLSLPKRALLAIVWSTIFLEPEVSTPSAGNIAFPGHACFHPRVWVDGNYALLNFPVDRGEGCVTSRRMNLWGI